MAGYLSQVGGKVAAANPLRQDPANKAKQIDPASLEVTAPGDITAPTGPGSNPVSAVGGAQVAALAAPTAATINMLPQNQFRDQQVQLAQTLAQQASGQGPSIAENQLRTGQEANIAATYAQANSARGGFNPALARGAMQTGAEIQGQMVQQAATARLQEQMAAQGQLAQVAGQGRATDLEAATQQAGLQQQATLAGYQGGTQVAIQNAQLDMQTQQTNAQIQQQFAALQAQYAAMGLDAQKANQMAALQVQQLQQQGILGAAGVNNQAALGNQQNKNAVTGAVLGAVGTGVGAAAALSDKTTKTDVKDGSPSVREFLDNLTVNNYRYKNPEHGEGRFTSVMAQDLIKTKLGKDMVVPTEAGLAVDYGKGFGAMLAAQADLHKRLAKLEKKKAA